MYGYRDRRSYRRGWRHAKKSYKRKARQRRVLRRARDYYASVYPRGSDGSKWLFGPSYSLANREQRAARRAFRYRGDGGYWGDMFKKIGKYGTAAAGTIMGAGSGFKSGGIAGALQGGYKGYQQGRQMSRYLGFGAYDGANLANAEVSENRLIAGPRQNKSIAVNEDHNSGDIVFTNTEFVQNIYASVASSPGTSAFQIQKFELNPGMANTFPFLSQIAQNFEMYELQGLMFQYKPTSGESGGGDSNALGKVIMCTNYDPDATDFVNSVQMENYDYANSTKPSSTMVHGVETAEDQRATKMLYVRTGESKKDKVFTDYGNLFLATEGVPFGGTGAQDALIGELWVTYKVRLSRSQLYNSVLGSDIQWAQKQISLNSGSVANDIDNPAAKFNLTFTLQGGATTAQSLIEFPPEIDDGYYLVVWNDFHGTNPTGDDSPLFSNFVNCTAAANVPITCLTTGATPRDVRSCLIEIQAQSNQNIASLDVTFDGTHNTTAGEVITITVTQVDRDMYINSTDGEDLSNI